MTDPSAGALERARLITDLLIADPPNKDNRGDVEEWICRELDAVQQPLRESNEALKDRVAEVESQGRDWIKRWEASQARVAELENKPTWIGLRHALGKAEAEVEALREQLIKANALNGALADNHVAQLTALQKERERLRGALRLALDWLEQGEHGEAVYVVRAALAPLEGQETTDGR